MHAGKLLLLIFVIFSLPAMAGNLVFEAPAEEEVHLESEPMGGSNAKKDNSKRVSATPVAPGAAPASAPATAPSAAPASPQKIRCKMGDGSVMVLSAAECKRKQAANKKN